MDERETVGPELIPDLSMHCTVNKGKVTLGRWRLDLAKPMGPGAHETCTGAACFAALVEIEAG